MHYTNYTTPQLQLHYVTATAALHHTLHPAVVGEVTHATTPKITTTFRFMNGFALPSMHHIALGGTTGI